MSLLSGAPAFGCTSESTFARQPTTLSLRSERNKMLNRLRASLGSRKEKHADRSLRNTTTKQTSEMHPQRTSMQAARRPAPGPNNPTPNAEDAPPAYSPAPPAIQTPSARIPSSTAPEADDPYAFLSSFDTIFLIDDSGSMAGGRWHETACALETIAPICTAHDADGIDLYFLNHPDSAFHHNVTQPGTVREIFQTVRPAGGTPTGQRLNGLLKPYLRRYQADPDATKPLNVICVTDGEPSDDVESPLIAAAKKLDKLDAPAWQIGVQFFQVGRDEAARHHLMQLDDELAEIAGDEALRDIVDTVPFTGAEGARLTGEGILKVVLGAVNRRLDRKKSRDLHR